MKRTATVVAVLIVAAAIWFVALRPTPLSPEMRDTLSRKVGIMNEALRMYAADFGSFPSTNDPAQVRMLLDPYLLLGHDWLIGSPPKLDEIRIRYSFPQGTSPQIQDRAKFELGQYTYRRHTIAAYADGHTAFLGEKQ